MANDECEKMADTLVSQYSLPANYKFLIMEAGSPDAMTAKAKEIAAQQTAVKAEGERNFYDNIREQVRKEQAAKQPAGTEELLRRLAKQRG